MTEKTFKTLFKKPIILIGIAILTLVPMLIYIPLSFAFVNDSFMGFSPMLTHGDADMSNFWLLFILIIAISLLAGILFVVFGYSPLTHYIGEVCQGTDSKGWYKRGLKKCWWRLLVYAVISYILLLILFLFSALLMSVLDVFGVIIYFIIMVFYSIIILIGINAVIIEDNFGTGLVNTFKVGIRYFFKTLGTLIVGYIPLVVLSSILSIDMFDTISYSANPAMDFYSSAGVLYWVITILCAIYSVFLLSYVLIYNSYNYIEYRKIYDETPYAEQSLTEDCQNDTDTVIAEDTPDLDNSEN